MTDRPVILRLRALLTLASIALAAGCGDDVKKSGSGGGGGDQTQVRQLCQGECSQLTIGFPCDTTQADIDACRSQCLSAPYENVEDFTRCSSQGNLSCDGAECLSRLGGNGGGTTDPTNNGGTNPITNGSTDPVNNGSTDPINNGSTDPINNGTDPVNNGGDDLSFEIETCKFHCEDMHFDECIDASARSSCEAACETASAIQLEDFDVCYYDSFDVCEELRCLSIIGAFP